MKDRGLNRAMIEQAEAVGASAVMVTIDNPGFYSKERVNRKTMVSRSFRDIQGFEVPTTQNMNSFQDQSLTWSDLAKLRATTSLPMVIKGIQTREDAVAAGDSGYDGVVVSNHGGHMLQDARASVDVLPEVVEAVGDRIEVYLDGGIQDGGTCSRRSRSGPARSSSVAPWRGGLTVGAHRGVERVLTILRQELDMAMGLCGIRSASEVPRSSVEL